GARAAIIWQNRLQGHWLHRNTPQGASLHAKQRPISNRLRIKFQQKITLINDAGKMRRFGLFRGGAVARAVLAGNQAAKAACRLYAGGIIPISRRLAGLPALIGSIAGASSR